jgi:hypothetical protein
MAMEANISSIRTGTILPLQTDVFQPDDGMGVLIGSKSGQEHLPPPWKTPDHTVTNTRTDFTRGGREQIVVDQGGAELETIGKSFDAFSDAPARRQNVDRF